MNSSEAEALRHFFVSKSVIRLKQVLPSDPKLLDHLQRRVDRLSERARFELVTRIYDEADHHTGAWVTRKRKDAKKALRTVIEHAVSRFRKAQVHNSAQFDMVWRSIADKLAEYCRKFFDWIDPGVHCESLGEDAK